MAQYTYYFLISLSILAGVVVYFLNVLTIRYKYRTLQGQRFKPNSAEYKRVIKLASGKPLIIMSIVGLLLVINVAISIYVLLSRYDRTSVEGVLLGGTIAILVIAISIIAIQSRALPEAMARKDPRNHD